MKKIILASLFLFTTVMSNAQEANKFRVGLELGIIPASKGLGIAFLLEPKYNIANNMNVGLRIGSTAVIKNIVVNGSVSSGQIQALGSYTGTFDYYFPSGDNFVPFVGAGIGYNSIVNLSLTDIGQQDGVKNIPQSNVVGGLLRGGFEWGKFRMGLEYNLLPKTPSYTIFGTKGSDVSNSYLGVDLGFYIGGGKWGK